VPPTPRPRAGIHPTTTVVAAVGLVVTAALAAATWSVHASNEDRLLRQRTREAGAVLTAALPSIQTPLASTAELVEVTAADEDAFDRAMAPLVGEQGPFVSASVWRLGGGDLRPVLVEGEQPALADQPDDDIRAYLDRSAATPLLAVIALFDSDDPRLGYAFRSPQDADYLVYAEGALPEDRTAVPQADNAFSDVQYAIYLGEQERDDTLIVASTPDLPFTGRRAAETVGFGDASLRLVLTPDGELGGSLLAWLPWLVALAGGLMVLSSSVLSERLLRRRDEAQALAADNSRLYEDQRNVAHTLQRSLLPERLPVVPGVELAVHYEPGVTGMEIGGDWYDVMLVGADRLLVVVGDVSGRGLEAASMMASLRYAIRAFASQGDAPGDILGKLNALDDPNRNGRFATVLCAVIDLTARTATIANAGHPNPLLLTPSGGARFIATTVGVPVGVMPEVRYASVAEAIPPGATLLAFTDGLFERRDESVDAGMARLQEAAVARHGSLVDLLEGVAADLRRAGPADDAALLGLRWQ
jgi:hypothetical protein